MEAEGRVFWDGQLGTFSFALDLSAAMTLIRKVRKYIVHQMGSPGSALKITARMLRGKIKIPRERRGVKHDPDVREWSLYGASVDLR